MKELNNAEISQANGGAALTVAILGLLTGYAAIKLAMK